MKMNIQKLVGNRFVSEALISVLAPRHPEFTRKVVLDLAKELRNDPKYWDKGVCLDVYLRTQENVRA